jgi:hypothetical protein
LSSNCHSYKQQKIPLSSLTANTLQQATKGKTALQLNKELMRFRPNKALETLSHHQTINTELEMGSLNPITPNRNSPNLHNITPPFGLCNK